MLLGLCRLHLRIPEAHSLKEKRAVLQSAITRLRARYNVSVAEVGHQDSHQEAELALAMVISAGGFVEGPLEAAVRYVEDNFPVELIDYAIERL